MEKQAFEIRVPNTDTVLWTNGKRKFAMENPGNWVRAIFMVPSDAYKALKYASPESRVMGCRITV